jgi:hypothetical protein
MVFRAEEDESDMDLDSSVPPDTASRGLCGGRSQRTDVSSLVGGYSSSLPCRALLQRLTFRSIRRSSQKHSTALWEGKPGNSPWRTLEYYLAATPGSLCPQDAPLLQVLGDARDMPSPLSAPLHPGSGDHLRDVALSRSFFRAASITTRLFGVF